MERSRLVARLVAGDEAAWSTFVEEYGRLIYAVAVKLGFDGPARDDLFQEACMSAFQSIRTLRDPDKLASWIYTITYRLGIDSLRRKRPEVRMDDAGQAALSTMATESEPDIVRDLERFEGVAHLLDAVQRLDARCRRLLTALYLEEPQPSYAEIGRREEMPIGSIGPTRARCLKKAGNLLREISNHPHPASSNRSRRQTPAAEQGLDRAAERKARPSCGEGGRGGDGVPSR